MQILPSTLGKIGVMNGMYLWYLLIRRFSAVLSKINETAVIAETGFLNDDISLNGGTQNNPNCYIPFFPSNTSLAAAWLNFSLYESLRHNMDLFIWWSDRDWMPAQISSSCPATILE